jgi:hypothetical protein
MTLFGVMPIDLLTMYAVAATLARNDNSLLDAIPFLAATLLLSGSPLLILLLLGRRGEQILPQVRTWMTANSWIVSEIVIAFFLVMTLNGMRT